jgi:YbbR domain-containing protein
MRLSVLRPRRDPPPAGDPSAPAPDPPPVPGWRDWLHRFEWREWIRRPRASDLHAFVRHNSGLKLFSILLAVFLWFSINVSERDAERLIEIPVSIRKLQRGLIVTNPPVKPVAITLRGPRTILDGVDEHKVHLAVDMSESEPGDVRVDLQGGMVRPELPRRLKAVRVEPSRMRLRVERLARRTLPVRIDLAGMPAFGYTVAESHVAPDRVEVTGPASKVDELKDVATEPIDLRGMKDNLQRSVLLAWAGDFVTFAPDHVTATVTFDEVMVSREFRRLDVRVVGAPDGLQPRVTPATVTVTVRGPQRLLHNYKVADGAPYVDASGLGAGAHKLGVRLDLPPALEVTARTPDAVQVQLTPRGGKR